MTNLLSGSQAFDELQRLKSRYGDVVSFTLFGTTVVLLNTYETIHEAANNSNRQKLGRYTLTTNHWLAKGFGKSSHLLFAYGHLTVDHLYAKRLRKFAEHL